jgi:hypothetical protein
MTEQIFKHYMSAARTLHAGTDYLRGYQYGLRRHYHGENFGDDATIDGYKKRGGGLSDGVCDGLAGNPPPGMVILDPQQGETRGRPAKYDEPTVQIGFRCPVSLDDRLPQRGDPKRAQWLVAAVREKLENDS